MVGITTAYHVVPVVVCGIPKTAFITKYENHNFKTMPSGLNTAPTTFQRLMELALSGLQWTVCLIYLDDVIMYGQDFEEYMQRLSVVLHRF